jgi:hypothetical protein
VNNIGRVHGLKSPDAQLLHAAFVLFFFFSALNFAHRNFVAFEIFALAAADITCFLT